MLCTLPFSVLSRMQIDRTFSGAKRRAIRELNYDSSTKVLALTARRFWESEDGIFGGGTYTDLPTGITYYSADNAQARDPKVSARPAVMLASYTWGQDARRLAALAHRERSALAGRVFQQPAGAPAIETGPSAARPAGDGAAHGELELGQPLTWMQGALESALRAVRDILSTR